MSGENFYLCFILLRTEIYILNEWSTIQYFLLLLFSYGNHLGSKFGLISTTSPNKISGQKNRNRSLDTCEWFLIKSSSEVSVFRGLETGFGVK